MKKNFKNIIKAFALCVVIIMATVLSACSQSGGETALEYKGNKISEAMYGYWSARFKGNILYNYNNGKDSADFWSNKLDNGQTAEKYFTEIVVGQINKYAVCGKLFDEYGLKLSGEVKKAIDDDIAEKIEYYGSRAELNAELAKINLNINMLRDIYICEEKLNAVYSYLYGKGGTEALTDDDYKAYFKENYWHMKYIVVYTTKLATDEQGKNKYDTSGSLLTEDLNKEELAAKKAKVAEALEKAQAGENFDSLIKTYSEFDTSSYPNGFYLSANELSTYGEQIVAALPGLATDECALIEEPKAIYIIKKLELPELDELGSDDLAQLQDMQSYANGKTFDAKINALSGDINVNKEIVAKYKLADIAVNADSNF